MQGVAENACLALRMRAGIYKSLPYDEYVLVDNTTVTVPTIVGEDDFRADTGCITQTIDRMAA
ncbi:hypothetical protein [Streptomyces sp. NPDC004284]|uniref:hypothetical protein n=1 Tax=Streptomyces sp. NPDC004284 TaxID=3364695 RepID=UPI0036B6AB85